jgi:LPS export ABC transporter protein LptC
LMVFNQVKATFFAPDGPMYITGDQGYYNQLKQNVLLTGQVSANDTQGNILQTRELEYDLETRVVSAPGDFKLSGPDTDLVGHGLSVDTKTNRLKVYGRPTLVFKSAKSIL